MTIPHEDLIRAVLDGQFDPDTGEYLRTVKEEA